MKCHLTHLPARCATASSSARRSGVCGHLSSCVKDEPRRHRVEAGRVALHQRQNTGMAEDEEPGFSAQLMTNAAASLWGFKLAG